MIKHTFRNVVVKLSAWEAYKAFPSKSVKRYGRKVYMDVVKKAISEHDFAVIACSFGRDSMVVLHKVIKECREQEKDFYIIWNDTGVEFPEQYKFNKRIIELWNLKDHLIVAKSEDWTFWKIKETYGMPIAPRDSRNRAMQQATQSCCYHLKKAPTKEVLKNFKGKDYVYFTGLTAQESMNRKASATRYGDYFYSKSWHHFKCHPILWWNDEQIDEYIAENDIPLCDIYSYTDIEGYTVRNGCMVCPQAWNFGKGKWLKKYYPKIFEYLINKTELGDYILKSKLHIEEGQIGFFSKSEIFENRPCFFEKF